MEHDPPGTVLSALHKKALSTWHSDRHMTGQLAEDLQEHQLQYIDVDISK